MLSADGHPALPAIPHFSRDMENALAAAARAGLGRPPPEPPGSDGVPPRSPRSRQ